MPKKKTSPSGALTIPPQLIERRIYLIRGEKVMLDEDLARMYRVPTKRLNEQVTRNIKRFPEDFMFQLSGGEAAVLRSQIETSKGRGGRRYLPRAFTEQGVAMLSSVLRSERAVQVNIAIVRAFVRLRQLLATHKNLARKIETLERKDAEHDAKFRVVFDAIRELMKPPPPAPRIGFKGRKR